MVARERQAVYTCNEYREEMILVALHKRLEEDGLKEEEKRQVEEEIRQLEEKMGL